MLMIQRKKIDIKSDCTSVEVYNSATLQEPTSILKKEGSPHQSLGDHSENPLIIAESLPQNPPSQNQVTPGVASQE